MDQSANSQAKQAFQEMLALGSEAYVSDDYEGYDFLFAAQNHDGKGFASYERSYTCDDDGIRPDVVHLLNKHSIAWEWVNPEVVGCYYEAE